MPELPEVETIRHDLERELVGRRILAVGVTGARAARRHGPDDDLASHLEGRKVSSVGRRGKFLLLHLDGPDALVVHLGMSGQLLWTKTAREPRPKHTHATISFARGGELRYVDPRTFGELFAAPAVDGRVAELTHLGFDPVVDAMSWTRFADMLSARHAKLKALLMDQRFVAGIGNLYADEILFEAGLRHDRSSSSLGSQEVRRLYRAMVETLQEAVRHRGSSLADRQYRDIFGALGSYQEHHKVYDREGKPCRRCRSPIARHRASGRSTFFCPSCQV